ncbi:MAG: amidohydrolase family protein [Chloroflexi bacterium]|nr:amidohydrolase family protein [Chloroflexota bacterium]
MAAGKTDATAIPYLKDAPPRVFDIHVHYPWRPDASSNFSPQQQADILAHTCRRLNIVKACLLGRRNDGWQPTLEAWRRYPDLFVPLAQVSLDEDGPEAVERLREQGFRGLKITMPQRNYDDPAYFPTYATAERLGLAILFHTGIRGGAVDFLLFPPRDARQAEAASERLEQMSAGSTASGARMQPIYLDTVGMAFPRLRIIGAHMGYGLYDTAAAVARWRRNVFFDISGGAVVRRHIVERSMIYREVHPGKLLFGSDCDFVHTSREVTAWMEAFAAMDMPRDDQDRIFYRNAAELFGEQ